MTAKQMTDGDMVGLVRNALLVAGMEMGKEGDHWPVIKSTAHKIMKDWEDLQVEQNVFNELKKHYGDLVTQMEKNLEVCPPEMRAEAEKITKEIRECYEACFAEPDSTMFVVCDEDIPIHVRRAGEIIKTLEDENA